MKTVEYKYVGFNVNKNGNCSLQISKKYNKIDGQINGIKSIANSNTIGSVFLQVRLELFESCVIPSVLCRLEAWNILTKQEIKQLELIQAKV